MICIRLGSKLTGENETTFVYEGSVTRHSWIALWNCNYGDIMIMVAVVDKSDERKFGGCVRRWMHYLFMWYNFCLEPPCRRARHLCRLLSVLVTFRSLRSWSTWQQWQLIQLQWRKSTRSCSQKQCRRRQCWIQKKKEVCGLAYFCEPQNQLPLGPSCPLLWISVQGLCYLRYRS